MEGTKRSDPEVRDGEKGAETADMGATEHRPTLYRILAVAAFVLAVGGLFLLFPGTLSAFTLAAVPEGTVLRGAPFGFVFAQFSALFHGGLTQAFAAGTVGMVGVSLIPYGLALLLCVAVLASVVLAIVSFASAKAAKNCATVSLCLLVLAYGSLMLATYFAGSYGMPEGEALGRAAIDVPALVVAGAGLLLLAISAIARRKGLGFFNFLLYLVTLVSVFAFAYPHTITVGRAGDLLQGGITLHLFVGVTLLFLLATFVFNLVASLLRLTARRAYAFDAVRFLLQFLAAALFVVASVVDPLAARSELFTQQLAFTLVLLIAPLAAGLASLFVSLGQRRRRDRDETVRRASEIGEPAAAPVRPEGENGQAAFPPAGTPVYVYPVLPEYGRPAPEYERRETPAAPHAEDTPMSEFERRMEALAKGETPAEPQNAPAPAVTPVFPKAQPKPQQQQMQTSYYDTQYTYDPFLNSLSPQEKNEFGDLFIGKKYGSFGLPAYVIGGENEEFFRKVFIYLGRFRAHISTGLLGKLYAFVNHS